MMKNGLLLRMLSITNGAVPVFWMENVRWSVSANKPKSVWLLDEAVVAPSRMDWLFPCKLIWLPEPNRMEMEAAPKLAVAMSWNPSPLKLPITARYGWFMVIELVPVNVPLPVPNRINNKPAVLFAVTKSVIPSPLKSPASTLNGLDPSARSAAAVNVPLPTPRRMDRLLEPLFATAKSSCPSPLKSPTATSRGAVPTVKLLAAVNVPLPFPRRMATVPKPLLATAASTRPSLLKSPTAIANGVALFPKAVPMRAPKPPFPLPNLTAKRLLRFSAINKSTFPSWLTSIAATSSATSPCRFISAVLLNPPIPLPLRIKTVPLAPIAKSSAPSPLKSAIATQRGWKKPLSDVVPLNPPNPSPIRMEAVPP